jgi:hypothetical protein
VDCGVTHDPAVPVLDDPRTITVWVHGFGMNAFGALDKIVYGSERGCGQFLKFLGDYGIDRPCADTPQDWRLVHGSRVDHLLGVHPHCRHPRICRKNERVSGDLVLANPPHLTRKPRFDERPLR